jgi:flagellar FliJ protein
MKFQFRFAPILQLRRQFRDDAGIAMGQAVAAIARIDERSREVEAERQVLRSTAHPRTGQISVDALLASGRYDMQLLAELQSLAQTKRELLQELDRRKQVLAAAEAEVKRFERLEEKDRTQFLAEQAKREQAELDDATARRFALIRRH